MCTYELLIDTGKVAGRQAHFQYELGDDSEDDTYDDKLRGEDFAAGMLIMNPFAAHMQFQNEINRGKKDGNGNSVDVRHDKGSKLHVPLDGAELELSKRKKEAEKKTITKRPKIPFFASERTRIRELIKWKEQQEEEEEQEKMQKLKEQQVLLRAARRREQQQRAELDLQRQMHAASEMAWNHGMSRGDHEQATSLSSSQVEMTSYWGRYHDRAKSDTGQHCTAAQAPLPRKSLVDIAMGSNSAQIRSLAKELQELQILVLQKKAMEMLKETSAF